MVSGYSIQSLQMLWAQTQILLYVCSLRSRNRFHFQFKMMRRFQAIVFNLKNLEYFSLLLEIRALVARCNTTKGNKIKEDCQLWQFIARQQDRYRYQIVGRQKDRQRWQLYLDRKIYTDSKLQVDRKIDRDSKLQIDRYRCRKLWETCVQENYPEAIDNFLLISPNITYIL